MSLEEAVNRNSDLLEKLVAQNEKILGIAASRQAASAASSEGEKPEKPKGKGKAAKAEEADAGDTKIAKAHLTKGLGDWMNEFGKPGEHPESTARHGALKTVLVKVGGDGFTLKDLGEDDQEKIDKLYNWLENTAKKADKGHGIGRLAADPVPAKDDGDDLGV